MEMLIVFVLLIVNFGISWFNAYSVGRSWADSKAIGGWQRVVVWSAAVMSACGFTWCYLIVLAFIAGALGFLPPRYMQLALEIGYVVIILPILGSGFAIWIDSVTTAWRTKSLGNVGVATWNTFAQVHNTYEAAKTLPKVLSDIGDAFKGGDSDDAKGKALMLALLLVIVALSAGALTTATIIKKTAKKYAGKVLGNAPGSTEVYGRAHASR